MTTNQAGTPIQTAAEQGRPEPAGAREPVLELLDVTKSYGDVEAVRGVSLRVYEGETVTLLGPSGCGKTTTLRIVLGLEQCSSGRVVYRGRDLDGAMVKSPVPIHRRNMGMVFQTYAIWPHMNVHQNIAYPLRIRRVKKAETSEAVDRVMELVGLDGLADRPATMLSGGQQQRVALARALVAEPSLLLLDEPFSNLDARLREEMRTEVKLIQSRLGITVLFVTHDQQEALSMSDRIAVMNAGRIEQLAVPEELYEQPRTKMVRDFLGRSNALDGFVDQVTGGEAVVRVPEAGHGQLRGKLCSDEPLSQGDACQVSIRPESTGLLPAGEGDLPAGHVAGVLRSRLFLGDRYDALVELTTGRHFVARIPTVKALEVGRPVWLSLPAEHLLIWPT